MASVCFCQMATFKTKRCATATTSLQKAERCRDEVCAKVVRRSAHGSRGQIVQGGPGQPHLRPQRPMSLVARRSLAQSSPAPAGPSAVAEAPKTRLQRSCADAGNAGQICERDRVARVFLDELFDATYEERRER